MTRRTCPGCGESFVLLRKNQFYCIEACRAATSWRRWNEQKGTEKERARYQRDREKRLEKSRRLQLRKVLCEVPDDVRPLREALYEFRGWQKQRAMSAK